MYRRLFVFQESIGQIGGYTIGAENSSCAHILGTLRSADPDTEFKVGPLTLVRYPLRPFLERARLLVAEGASTFQIYDGGLREFLVALHLAKKFTFSQVIFNFHWATQWVGLLQSKAFFSRFLVASMTNCVKRAGSNLRLSAESAGLASLVQQCLGVDCDIYPVFSALGNHSTKSWTYRQTEVLVMPQRVSEIPFVLELVQNLIREGISALVSTRPEVWERGCRMAESNGIKIIQEEQPRILEAPLSDDAYQTMLADSKIVVLPYDKPYFQWGSSGKFNEAICMGAFPFVPSNTSIATQSSLPEPEHVYEIGDVSELVQKIKVRLKRGFPSGLSGVKVEDFFSWADFPPANQVSTAPSQARLRRADLLRVHLASGLWRPPNARVRGLRKRLASILTVLRQPISRSRADSEGFRA